MKCNESDYFTLKMGSKIWPSEDPNDSPFDDFTCKLCGYTFNQQMCGSSFQREPSFQEQAHKKMVEHLMEFHIEKLDGTNNSEEMEKINKKINEMTEDLKRLNETLNTHMYGNEDD